MDSAVPGSRRMTSESGVEKTNNGAVRVNPAVPISVLLLKPQVSVTQAVSAVGMACWPVTLTGWPAKVGGVSHQEQTLSGTGARVYTAHRRGDGYQCGLDWGRSSSNDTHCRFQCGVA